MNGCKKTIIISAGGTGGHIFPALAVAAALESAYNIIWVGGKVGLETTLIPQYGYKLHPVSVTGVRNKGLFRKLLLPVTMFKALVQSFLILWRYRPVAIVGFGGYATFPIALMGKLFGCSVIIHEQNSVAGLSNRVLSHIAKVVLTAFPGVLVSKKTFVVGNPVRHSISQVPAPEVRLLPATTQLRVLVVGGSLGAKALNETVPRALATIAGHLAEVVHQVGRGDVAAVTELYQQAQISAQVLSFIEDIAAVYATTDVIICRAGALTVAEVAAAGVAAIFIPYPAAVDDHQTHNAEYLVKAAAAILIPQAQLSVERLATVLAALTPAKCQQLAIRARHMALLDSTEQISILLASILPAQGHPVNRSIKV